MLDVREGPRFRVRHVSTTGNTVLTTPTLLQDLPVAEGEPFLPFAAANALARIRDLYWRRGYNDATPAYSLAVNRELGEVDVAFTIREGAQSVVTDIVVSGQDKTSDRLVREQLELQPSRDPRPRRFEPIAAQPVRHRRLLSGGRDPRARHPGGEEPFRRRPGPTGRPATDRAD